MKNQHEIEQARRFPRVNADGPRARLTSADQRQLFVASKATDTLPGDQSEGARREASLPGGDGETERARLHHYINLKLASMGLPVYAGASSDSLLELSRDLLRHHYELSRLLSAHQCPADQRIQSFLDEYLSDLNVSTSLCIPTRSFVLDREGLSRELSLPPDNDHYHSEFVSSYRVLQGVLHNPVNDRRTTKGIFHIAEGGFAIPADKISVPKLVYWKLLEHAFNPPRELLRLPFTASQFQRAETFVSLLLRPTVCPEVVGHSLRKSMEVRFFAPGSLVGNLDFVESIFGNAGDPYLPENDAGMDVEHWTGHTGCVVLAPHLVRLSKKELGLPHRSEAGERQLRDGMYWSSPNEFYNDGQPFKLTARDQNGVMVTILADNYFGYCKKEIKTQISFSANLYGLVEEEHAGGAIAFPCINLGTDYQHNPAGDRGSRSFESLEEQLIDQPEGHATDKTYPDIIYVPEGSHFCVAERKISWEHKEKKGSTRLLPGRYYLLPDGYMVRMEKHPTNPLWRLVGTGSEGVHCHKPCTVSGGGKSEISKPITDNFLYGPYYVNDLDQDLDAVESIFNRELRDRFDQTSRVDDSALSILDAHCPIRSVIQLLTPSIEYTDEHNNWIENIPGYIRSLAIIVKLLHKTEWGDSWREHFGVDIINGSPGHELKLDHQKLVAGYLRVGIARDGSWRTFRLRQDYISSLKIQTQDDISASIILPAGQLEGLDPSYSESSVKLVENCEQRLFQRPDDAIHRGRDALTEREMSNPNNFLANYEPLTSTDADELRAEAVEFDAYTQPMKKLIRRASQTNGGYFVSSAHPRIVDGKPSKNPRYLQPRLDLMEPIRGYIAEMGARLNRGISHRSPVHFSISAVLPGHRNNPPDPERGIRSLAVYNPIHYLELPELFMDYIASITGKSPSTTGAGLEGALTKGPFNALTTAADLNNALVGYILTGHCAFFTAAGFVGPNIRVDHDISMLVPELWCRMSIQERNPAYLIELGMLEKLENFHVDGARIRADRLGYRITSKFVNTFLGRIFDNPAAVFPAEILEPERQDRESFADGICNIVEAQRVAANYYFEDGSVRDICPPLRALLHIMAEGSYEGHDIEADEIRSMFTREYLLSSDWYKGRLLLKQHRDIALWQRHVAYLKKRRARDVNVLDSIRVETERKLDLANETLRRIQSLDYLSSLEGTIGADPIEQI